MRRNWSFSLYFLKRRYNEGAKCWISYHIANSICSFLTLYSQYKKPLHPHLFVSAKPSKRICTALPLKTPIQIPNPNKPYCELFFSLPPLPTCDGFSNLTANLIITVFGICFPWVDQPFVRLIKKRKPKGLLICQSTSALGIRILLPLENINWSDRKL